MIEYALLIWFITFILLCLLGLFIFHRTAWDLGLSGVLTLVFLLSLAWWPLAGGFLVDRIVLLVNVSMTGFALGGLLGFVLTSHADEEANSVGRLRDWVLGGITGLTLVDATNNFATAKRGLEFFAVTPEARALTAGAFVVYGVVGFFAMFFTREVIWNVLFNEGRKKAAKALLASREAASKTLDDTNFIDSLEARPDAAKTDPSKTGALTRFVQSAEKMETTGGKLPISTQEDLGRAYYHLGAYEKATETLGSIVAKKGLAAGKGLLYRLADSLVHQGRATEAVALLQESLGSLGVGAKKLIGYYLLWDSERLEESLRYTKEYIQQRPRDSAAVFNAACATAQLSALRRDDATLRQEALDFLAKAIAMDDSWRLRAIELSSDADGDFFSLKNNEEFLKLVAPRG